jgi:hypothetical protein
MAGGRSEPAAMMIDNEKSLESFSSTDLRFLIFCQDAATVTTFDNKRSQQRNKARRKKSSLYFWIGGSSFLNEYPQEPGMTPSSPFQWSDFF